MVTGSRHKPISVRRDCYGGTLVKVGNECEVGPGVLIGGGGSH